MLPDDSEEDDLFREESMLRKIIEIDETACNGCGLCTQVCPFDALGVPTAENSSSEGDSHA